MSKEGTVKAGYPTLNFSLVFDGKHYDLITDKIAREAFRIVANNALNVELIDFIFFVVKNYEKLNEGNSSIFQEFKNKIINEWCSNDHINCLNSQSLKLNPQQLNTKDEIITVLNLLFSHSVNATVGAAGEASQKDSIKALIDFGKDLQAKFITIKNTRVTKKLSSDIVLQQANIQLDEKYQKMVDKEFFDSVFVESPSFESPDDHNLKREFYLFLCCSLLPKKIAMKNETESKSHRRFATKLSIRQSQWFNPKAKNAVPTLHILKTDTTIIQILGEFFNNLYVKADEANYGPAFQIVKKEFFKITNPLVQEKTTDEKSIKTDIAEFS